MACIGPRFRDWSELPIDLPWQMAYYQQILYRPVQGPFNIVNGRYDSSRLTKTMEDVCNPFFRERLDRGEIVPTNYYHKEEENFSQNSMSINLRKDYPKFGYFPGNYYAYKGDFPLAEQYWFMNPLTIDGQAKIDMYNTVVTKALANVASNKMLIGATIAEFGETTSLLKNSVKAATRVAAFTKRFTAKLKKSKLSAAKLMGDEGSDLWMEFRMGWRPFLHEVDTLSQTIFRIKSDLTRKTFRACDQILVSEQLEQPAQWGSYLKLNVRKTVSQRYFVKSGVLCEHRTNGYPDTYGVSINYLPETLWELTPCSWAVDYLFNVGDQIRARTPDTLWQPKDWFVTVVEESKQTVSVTGTPMEPWTGNCSMAWMSRQCLDITRNIVTELPDAITFRPRLNWAKNTDLIVLAKQQLVPALKNLRTVIGNLLSHTRKRK